MPENLMFAVGIADSLLFFRVHCSDAGANPLGLLKLLLQFMTSDAFLRVTL
jgi:hypothetical protein